MSYKKDLVCLSKTKRILAQAPAKVNNITAKAKTFAKKTFNNG